MFAAPELANISEIKLFCVDVAPPLFIMDCDKVSDMPLIIIVEKEEGEGDEGRREECPPDETCCPPAKDCPPAIAD